QQRHGGVIRGFAEEVKFSGERPPRLDQAGRLINFQNKFFVELSRPPRPLRSRRLREISLVASTPPDPGGEFARLRIDFMCKAVSCRLVFSDLPCVCRKRVSDVLAARAARALYGHDNELPAVDHV